MRPYSGRVDTTASSRKIEVDHRLSLRIYFRIADSILRQATIFRNEKNIIDLYLMLLRYSSLVSETIPRHRDYAASPQVKKNSLRKQLLVALNELEELKPAVKQKLDERNRKPANQSFDLNHNNHRNVYHTPTDSVEWPPVTRQSRTNDQVTQCSSMVPYGGLNAEQNAHNISLEERFRRFYRTNYFIMIVVILGLGFLRRPLSIVAAALSTLSVAFLNDSFAGAFSEKVTRTVRRFSPHLAAKMRAPLTPVIRPRPSAKRAIYICGRPRWMFVSIFCAASCLLWFLSCGLLTVLWAFAVGLLATILHASFRTPNLKARLNTFREEFRAVWRNYSEL